MLYLAFIFHMHQPYYKNLLTGEIQQPWVRLHGIKDYLDMVQMLEKYPKIHQTFNLVPSLLEQVEDYTNLSVKPNERFLNYSLKPAADLTPEDKAFILEKFFYIDREMVISTHPRFYELYFKKSRAQFTTQDYLDLQVWYNLAWFDPYFRENIPELAALVAKGRFFTEEDKRTCLAKQTDVLREIVPAYKRFIQSGQVEVTISPFYHPILPLLYNTNTGKEANPRTVLPKKKFAYPEDAWLQISGACKFFHSRFDMQPAGMWPSEESVSEHIVPLLLRGGIRWIVTDEGILFKSLRSKKRDTVLLYQPHLLKREEGEMAIVFRDRNLSDMIGFTYHHWNAEDAVNDFLYHLGNIHRAFRDNDALVTIAMDGENAWEYFRNDGHDFLETLYARLSDVHYIRTTTISEYLNQFPPKKKIKRLAAGSWIYSEFGKWIGNPYKTRAWDVLAEARNLMEEMIRRGEPIPDLAWKQMMICEGSDWFWWAGEDPNGDFDAMYRMHLKNFYTLINKPAPDYLNSPLVP